MHSLRCLRIMQLKTFIIFGLVSLFFTFMILVFHHRVLTFDDSAPFKTGKHHASLIQGMDSGKDGNRASARNISQELLSEKEKLINQAGLGQEFVHGHSEAAKQMLRNEMQYEEYFKDSRPPLNVPRLAKYCNLPHNQMSGDEGLVPKAYKLLSVQVVIRHGDRSPIYKLPNGHRTELSCIVDTSQFTHIPKVVSYPHVMAAAAHETAHHNTFQSWSIHPSRSVCGEGQLTGQGAIQQILNGMHFSERYLHQHQLFSEEQWPDNILVHTTESSRTYQSALAFVYGFVPSFNVSKVNIKMSPFINFCENRVFGTSCQCHGLESFRFRADGECRQTEKGQEGASDFKRVMAHVSSVLGISSNAIPGPTTLMDGMSGHTCHSIPYPCNAKGACITARTLEDTWKIIDARSRCLAKNRLFQTYASVSIYGLLHRIARNFNSSLNNGINAKLHIYSGHDTTVTPLIVALGLTDSVWPGYAHRISFELYTKSSRHFIRVLQNGNVVTDQVSFCKDRTMNGGLCNFQNFLNYLSSKHLREFCNPLKLPLGKAEF